MTIFLPEQKEALDALPATQRIFVLGNLFLYIFNGCQQADIRENFKQKKVVFDFLTWRRHLHTNGLLLRDGKLYLYAKAARRVREAHTRGLVAADLDLLDQALRYRPLKEHLQELITDPFCRVLSPRKFDEFATAVLQSDDLRVYMRKFVSKKMGFLITSYNVNREDLEHTLLSAALYGLQRAYPRFEHVGHGIAIAKTLVKRRGVNLIDELTAKKHNQLIHNTTNGTYTRTTVSLDAIEDGTGQFLTSEEGFVHRSLLVVGIGGVNTFDNLPWEMAHSLKELCNSSRLKTKQREFLHLMVGSYSEAFSEFLGRSNDDYLEEVSYAAYMQKVCNFMSIPLQAAQTFLSNLKPQLGGHVHESTTK